MEPMRKFGTGTVIPEPGDDQKTAAKHFTDKDREELVEESTQDDDDELASRYA
jgi:hypothetical protein